MKIVFPEINNDCIQKAIKQSNIEPVAASSLEEACAKLKNGEAEAMMAGADYTSRDVILACKNHLGMTDKTFSSCMVLDRDNLKKYIVADVATCKTPTKEQLYDIVLQTYTTAKKVLNEAPKIAMLSFSTFGSGSADGAILKIRDVLINIRKNHPEIEIDGEMQLDAAVVPEIAAKKAPNSLVAGKANVLICPDLNSGNILYKAMGYFGGFTAAGPILQGFNFPVSDLSRGSSVEDIVRAIEIIKKLA